MECQQQSSSYSSPSLMNGYNRVTFGHPTQESERGQRFYEFNTEPITTSIRREHSNQEFGRERYVPGRGINKQTIMTKLNNMSEQLYEVIFLKESVMSMVGEQRVKMGDFMREIKKYLFQLGVKSQRESLTKQSRMLNESSEVELREANSYSKVSMDDNNQLQRMCEQLMKENGNLREKYEQMLLHYRTEIQSLSSALSRPQEQLNYSNQQIRELKQIAFESQEKLKQEQARFAERVKYLESEILALEDQYLKEKESYERQIDQYRIKQRQIAFHESQIQRKNILLIERQKLLTQREIIAKQEKNALDRRETKISDYEYSQLKREKQKMQQEKHALKSQYYVSYDRIPEAKPQPHVNRFSFDTKSEREKSSGSRLVNSRVDINARLRQIQMEKRGNNGGIKNSRMSQAGGLRTNNRSSSKDRNFLTVIGYQAPRKQIPPQNINMKLESMLESLQRDLSDMK